MDIEIEEVATLLFPNGLPESWKDREDLSTYLASLASSGVDKLGRESSHLREERAAILNQTKDLAYSNYKTFIHTADCSKAICSDFSDVESHLENLSSSLPTLKTSVDKFLATSKNLSQSRHLTSLTLGKHTQLLEILELPQLMDTCVRNNYYDEALEIMAYVRRLEKKHPDIPIISSIVVEVQAGSRLMLNQLLSQLRSPLTLPQCLKTVGLLRQLDVFTESELRLKFLLARDAWMMGVIRAIPREDAYQHITKVVETARVNLFDIVTQYRAIFCDDDTKFSHGDPEVNESAIFQGWIVHKVNQFLRIVEKDLDRGVGANLEHVLAQCMYFGQSFSRIGADFRNLLIPMFLNASINYFKKDVRAANHKFDESLSSFSLMETSPIPSSTSYLVESQDKTRPSLLLMEFPPLAHYMNGLAAAFNSLRQCCPIGIIEDVLSTIDNSLSKVVSAIIEVHRLESAGFTPKEESAFKRMCNVVATALVPHLNLCLRLMFPLEHISKITGTSVSQLEKNNFGQLDVEKISEPISEFIPEKTYSDHLDQEPSDVIDQDLPSPCDAPDLSIEPNPEENKLDPVEIEPEINAIITDISGPETVEVTSQSNNSDELSDIVNLPNVSHDPNQLSESNVRLDEEIKSSNEVNKSNNLVEEVHSLDISKLTISGSEKNEDLEEVSLDN